MRIFMAYAVGVFVFTDIQDTGINQWTDDMAEKLLEPDTASAKPALAGENITIIPKTRASGTSIMRVVPKPGEMMPDACSEPYTEQDKFAAFGAIVDETGKEKVVMDFDGDERRYAASLSKMMTLLLALEDVADGKITLDARIPVTNDIRKIPSTHFFDAYQYKDDTISLQDALMLMGNRSANDAAMAVSVALVGKVLDYGWAEFANRMTKRAWALGMHHTRFAEAAGFVTSTNHRSTARDMYILKRYLDEKFPQSRDYLGTLRFEVSDGDRKIRTSNGLPQAAAKGLPETWRVAAIKSAYVPEGGRSVAVTYETRQKPFQQAHFVVMGGAKTLPLDCLGALARMTLRP